MSGTFWESNYLNCPIECSCLKSRFFNFCESFISDFENFYNLLHLNESEDDVSEEKDLENDSSVEIGYRLNVKDNAAKMLNNR